MSSSSGKWPCCASRTWCAAGKRAASLRRGCRPSTKAPTSSAAAMPTVRSRPDWSKARRSWPVPAGGSARARKDVAGRSGTSLGRLVSGALGPARRQGLLRAPPGVARRVTPCAGVSRPGPQRLPDRGVLKGGDPESARRRPRVQCGRALERGRPPFGTPAVAKNIRAKRLLNGYEKDLSVKPSMRWCHF